MPFYSRTVAFTLATSLFLPLGISSASAASPKPGATCSKSGQAVRLNAMVYTCVKSGKKLVWSKGVPEKKVPSPSMGQPGNGQPGNGQPGNGQPGNGQPGNGQPGNGQPGNGQPGNGQPGGSPTQQQQLLPDTSFLYMRRIGMSCSTNGVFGFTGGMLAICKNNIVKYALPTDIPAAPVGGYKTRPSWYPSLAQQQGQTSEPTCAPSSIKFTSPVVPIAEMAPSIPYGMMVAGHVTPIDHGYLGIKVLGKVQSTKTESDYVPVTSPAAGTITSIGNLGGPATIRVVIEHGCNVSTVYMVLNRLSGVLASYAEEMKVNGANKQVSIPVKAGEEFGRQRDNMIDFNVWDGTQWLSGFENPFSYTSGEAWKPFTADPLPFFTPELRTAIESFMQRTTSPRFGKIDYDVPGTASGNWFLDGTMGYSGRFISEIASATGEMNNPTTPGKNEYDWSHLAIAPHEVDSGKWIFSTGWWSDPAGDPRQTMMNIEGSRPTPDKLTSASGMVAYQLVSFSPIEPVTAPARTPGAMAPYAVGYTLGAGMPLGVVALQVNTDGSLNVEVNTTMTQASQFTAFTSSKRIYRR